MKNNQFLYCFLFLLIRFYSEIQAFHFLVVNFQFIAEISIEK